MLQLIVEGASLVPILQDFGGARDFLFSKKLY